MIKGIFSLPFLSLSRLFSILCKSCLISVELKNGRKAIGYRGCIQSFKTNKIFKKYMYVIRRSSVLSYKQCCHILNAEEWMNKNSILQFLYKDIGIDISWSYSRSPLSWGKVHYSNYIISNDKDPAPLSFLRILIIRRICAWKSS